MRKIITLLTMVALFATTTFAQTVNVTFQVNAANVTTDAAGLFLAGGGTFGNPGDNPMTDPNGTDVWEITVQLNVGQSTDYTFTNGNCPSWGCKEVITGQSCAVAPWDDRHFPGAWSDTTVQACFGSCEFHDGTCPAPATTIDVTFLVDMNAETVDPAVGVSLGGSFEGWSAATPLTDADNDGIWEYTATFNTGQFIEWKYVNGSGWGNEEVFDSTLHGACTQVFGDMGQFINRVATLGSSDTTLPAFIFNSCDLSTSTKAVFTKDELFEITPTLVSNEAIINFKEDVVFADKQIQVINAVGQVVFNESVGQAAQYRLDASTLANGLYFVVIQSEGFAQTARILVSK